MNKTKISAAGVNAILIIASLIPLYFAVYHSLGNEVHLSIFFTTLVAVLLLHFYYGYKWAKYIVAFFSLFFVVTQVLIFKPVFTNWKNLLSLLFCILLIINTLFLFRLNVVSEFLSQQSIKRSKQALFLLKTSRWVLFALIAVGITKDLLRFAN